MEKIRVLLVTYNPTIADNFTKLLHFEHDLDVVAQVHTGKEGISSFKTLAPGVVLMDRGFSDMERFEATAAILEINPIAQVILLGIEPGTENVRRAIKCGAADFLTAPVDAEALVASIREAAAKGKKLETKTRSLIPEDDAPQNDRYRKPIGKTIAIYCGKGGVGCTTIATNLALALHGDETPCVLVDADLQHGDVLALLNLQARLTIADIASHQEGLDEEMIREALLAHASGLCILAAPLRPEMADEVRVEAFNQFLELLQRSFAYIVVDTACRLDDLALAVLETADLIVSPMAPDFPSIKNTQLFLETLSQLDIPREKVLLVLNQLDKSDPIRAENISLNLHHELSVEIPLDYKSVRTSINRGEPLLKDRKTHPLTKSLLDLVRMVRDHLLVVVEA